jgi:hypothetical protein
VEVIINKQVAYGIFTVQLRNDGIIHIHADADKTIDLKMYKGLIEVLGKITEGKKVPILNTSGELTLPDDEVRTYMTRPDANPYSLATALVVPSLSQKLIYNFFIKIMKPARPVRLFVKKEDAINWLRGFLDSAV